MPVWSVKGQEERFSPEGRAAVVGRTSPYPDRTGGLEIGALSPFARARAKDRSPPNPGCSETASKVSRRTHRNRRWMMRVSRPVLRARGGETPLRDSPDPPIKGSSARVSTIRSAIVVRQRFFGIFWPLFLAGSERPGGRESPLRCRQKCASLAWGTRISKFWPELSSGGARQRPTSPTCDGNLSSLGRREDDGKLG